ncbi:anti-phage dCTP deaminase [Rhizobium sp.]|uniref:anti-phage dCTP deaminase n=1 Tax=Rhizobium sp. TaxID=391 RepID=UPI002AA6DCD0
MILSQELDAMASDFCSGRCIAQDELFDIEALCETISQALAQVKYQSYLVKLTDEMGRFEQEKAEEVAADLHSQMNWKMDRANALRSHFKSQEVMSRIAIQAIREIRRSKTSSVDKPQHSVAYIIRQLKLPQEVTLLRRVYGRQFILVSAYASEAQRLAAMEQQLAKSLPTDTSSTDVTHLAGKLIARDAKEDGHGDYGQNLSETFHLADLFTHGLDKNKMETTIERFFQAFFGRNDISPSREEFGLYAAKSASLRSADLSRQVGAAIFSEDGELVTQGCNEVPKALGGNYWDGDDPDNRDISKGHDPNDKLKKEVIRNVVERLQTKGFLSDTLTSVGNSFKIVDYLTDKKNENGVLSDAHVMDLTEYGRIVHAEMNAVCDAARIGRSVKGSTLYCTTFPCHNCAKHLIASGIKQVVFLEPYPKSKAYELYADEIQIEADQDPNRVAFIPFLGISPYRYRDIFQKGKRKTGGKADKWYSGEPKPMLEIEFPSYSKVEQWALVPLIGAVFDEVDEPKKL